MAPPWSPQYRSPKPPLQVRFIFCENYHFNLIVSGTCIILLSPSIYLTAPFLSAHIMSGHHFAPLLFPPTELCFSPFINSYTIALLLKYHAHKHTSKAGVRPTRPVASSTHNVSLIPTFNYPCDPVRFDLYAHRRLQHLMSYYGVVDLALSILQRARPDADRRVLKSKICQ